MITPYWMVRLKSEKIDHYTLANSNMWSRDHFGTIACTGKLALCENYLEHNTLDLRLYTWGWDEGAIYAGTEEIRVCKDCQRVQIMEFLGE